MGMKVVFDSFGGDPNGNVKERNRQLSYEYRLVVRRTLKL